MKIQIRQLPDIDKYRDMPSWLDDYGRFGETHKGFYVLPIHSSHMPNTKNGGYWGINKKMNILYLSPRNITIGFEEFVRYAIHTGNIIEKIIKIAGRI